jgi:UDP-N-acetylmuramoyl-tripeptide--D-alanyl-D-alanine ligase
VVRRDWDGGEGLDGARVLRVEDPERALLEFAAGYRRERKAVVVGVTGSVGKTSTKELTAAALGTVGATVKTEGNFNNQIGLPLSLVRLEADTAFGVFEAGISHPGEMADLARAMGPDAAVVSRVAPVHIEFFPSERAIAEEKAGLVEAVPPKGFAVLDADGAHFEAFRERCRCRVVRCARVGWRGEADYWGEPLEGGLRLRVREEATGEEAELPVPPPGAYMAENLLRAVACARQYGAAWDGLKEAIGGWRAVGMRWAVGDASGVAVVNDAYNANPASMRAAADAFLGWRVAGKRWLALGPMLELGAAGPELHRELGEWLARRAPWAGLAVAGWREDAAELATAIHDGWKAGGGGEAVLAESPEAAAAWLEARAEPGDAVLLKASRGIRAERILEFFRKGG